MFWHESDNQWSVHKMQNKVFWTIGNENWSKIVTFGLEHSWKKFVLYFFSDNILQNKSGIGWISYRIE